MSKLSLEEKRKALIELRLARKRLVSVPREGRLPLSHQQEGLWFLDRLNPGLTVYTIPFTWRLRGPLDVERLRDALGQLVARHEALRTRFPEHVGRPYQVIDPPPHEFEWSDGPFDLESGPVFRAQLTRVGDDEHLLTCNVHHITADGWSIAILTRELADLYHGKSLPPLELQPVDVAAWQRRQPLDDQLAYWRERLAGLSTLDFPADRPRPAVRTWSGDGLQADIDAALGSAAAELARTERASFLAVLQAGLLAVLARYTGQEDVVIGSVFSGRTRAELEPLVGYFATTLVLRTDVSGDPTFRELVGRCHETVLGANMNQDVPFSMVVDALKPERDPSRNPLFQISLSFQPASWSSGGFRLGDDIEVEPVAGDIQESRFDIAIGVAQLPDGALRVSLEYSTELFDAARMHRLAEHLEMVLRQGVANPSVRLSRLRLLTAEQEHFLLHDLNPTPTNPSNALLGDLIGTNDHTAIRHGTTEITYRELNERANQLAHHLQQTCHPKPDDIIAILLDRGPDLVIAQLAVTRAGAAWLPLDPTHPPQRHTYLTQDAQAITTITTHTMQQVLDTPTTPPAIHTQPDDLAYVIYTSGSTGQPKGVMITHRAVVDFTHTAQQLFRITEHDTVLQFANPCFDVSIFDIFTTLASGATLLTAPRHQLHDPDQLTELLRDGRVTVAPLPPAVLGRLDPSTPLPDLRLLMVAGEAFNVELVNQWARPGLEFHNGYGPTEATVLCTDHLCEPGTGPVPIGRAMANHRAYILDPQLQPVPIGIPGELYISGTGLARGYLNQPQLTQQRFIPNPHHPNQPMYRTGDLARWRHDHTIEYLGRTDRQLKLNGIRIEPAEIEHALLTYQGVTQAHTTVIHNQLAAYITTTQPIDMTALRTHLLDHLPTALIPTTITTLDALPTNANGKVDTTRLPAPTTTDAGRPPTTPTEQALAQLWQQLLPTPAQNTTDNFFTLGGNSLQAIQLLTRIHTTLHTQLNLRQLYVDATIAGLATLIDTSATRADAMVERHSPLVTLRANGSRPPLFCVHAVGGSAAPFLPLANRLGDEQPVYGLEAFGLYDGEPLGSVEEMATAYLAEIRRARPDGPYHLLGWSGGGLIALELAARLHALGWPVATVTLLDTMLPQGGRMPDHAELLSYFVRDVTAQAGAEGVHLDPEELRDRSEAEQSALVIKLLEEAGLAPAGIDTQLRARMKVFSANSLAFRRYRVRPPVVSGRLTVMSAAQGRPSAEVRRDWDAMEIGNFAYMVVPGSHYTMVQEPHVAAVADAVRACLGA